MVSPKVYGTPHVVIKAEAEVGEGPVFDPRSGRLVWVDILGGAIHEYDLDTGHRSVTSLGTMVGAVAPRVSDDGFAVAVSDGFGFVSDGVLHLVDRVLPEPDRRMNDAKVDCQGRLWAGSTHMEFVRGVGALHRWDGGTSEVVADGFILPNGLGWNSDDSVMYLADSFAHRLLRATFDPDDGLVTPFEPLVSVDAGLPDGLAVDIEGCVWLAVWGASQVHRYTPMGALDSVVPMPVAQPSSCAFGDDGTLYITSARAGLSDTDLREQPLAGSVFGLETSTQGVPVRSFAA